jgi:hypothetical protein
MPGTDVDQVEQLRVHGDEVDAERLGSQRLGRGDFRVQQGGRHRAAGNHAKPPGIGYGRHQMPFRHPAHRPAQNGGVAAQKLRAAGHEGSEFGVGHVSFFPPSRLREGSGEGL